MTVTLASASPRRKELLSMLVSEFESVATNIDETPFDGELPEKYVVRMALEKADAAKACDSVVIASDTIVVLSGRILQKPNSIADARGMLRELSGRTHEVMTAVVVVSDGKLHKTLTVTRVTFADLLESHIHTYLETDEPWDKAGAYGIQGLAGTFVRKVEGSYSAVVGLPLCETRELLEKVGMRTRMSDISV